MAMGALFGAGEMEEEDGEGAGAADEQGEVDSGDEGSSLGEAVDDTPSWVHGGFDSAEAEQEYWDRQERETAPGQRRRMHAWRSSFLLWLVRR